MTWLTWRQLRTQAAAVAALVAAVSIVVLVTGPRLRDLVTSATGVYDSLTRTDQVLFYAGLIAVAAAPAVIGAFWGAPLVARELENGTHRLVWNQSVTRFRWLTVKLLLVGVSCAAVAGLVAWWVETWSTPLDDASKLDPRLPMEVTFAAHGVVPVTYAVFAFALGVTAGMLTKRVIPAMALTLVMFLAAQVAVALLVRPHLAPSHTSVAPVSSATLQNFNISSDGIHISADASVPGAWLLSRHMVDATGAPVDTLRPL